MFAEGRFVVKRKLGEGGMGVVYEVVDSSRGARVALKTLRRSSVDSMVRLKHEFRSLADLTHPNLVSLYELHAAAEQTFFTMELVEGVTFSEYIRTASACSAGDTRSSLLDTVERTIGELEPPTSGGEWRTSETTAPGKPAALPFRAVDFVRVPVALGQLAQGVQAIHESGLLHRDLKPSNVLVTEPGRLVILDFGLASSLEDQLDAGENRPLEGTIPYMSPEQAARRSLSPASDWYAVGAMLYQALTGRPPFVGSRADILAAKQQLGAPRPPSTFASDIPAELDDLTVKLLARDPEKRAGPAEVFAWLSAVGSPRPARPGPPSISSGEPLVGRQSQLQALRQAFGDVQQGRPIVAHIFGRSGMGKSRLLRAFLEEAGEGGALLLQGRCYEREWLPFKALDSLVDALARHLVALGPLSPDSLRVGHPASLLQLFPALRQVDVFAQDAPSPGAVLDPQELRRLGFAGLRELLGWLTARRPLVLAIDDVQWGDADSAHVIGSLLRAPDAPPVLYLLGHRSEDLGESEFLSVLEHQLGAETDRRQVAVEQLAAEEARALATVHLRGEALSAASLDWLVSESQGVPLFVEELARSAREGGAAPRPQLAGLLQGRLRRLPEPAGLLLQVVATAGRPIPIELALRAAATDDPAIVQVLKAASLVRVRVASGTRLLECFHDRVREVACGVLDPDETRDRHRRLALAYEQTPSPDAEILAQHLAGAGEAARAAEFAVQAACNADRLLAFDRAAQLYRSALELDPSLPRAVRQALAEALVNAGRATEAAEALLATVAGAPAAEALALRGRAAAQLLYAGHVDRGMALVAEVLAELGVTLARSPARAMASVAWQRLRLRLRGLDFREREASHRSVSGLEKVDLIFSMAEGLGTVDPLRAADLHLRHLRLALGTGEPARAARALSVEAAFQSLRGVPARAEVHALCARVDELAARAGDPAAAGMAAGCRGVATFHLGEFAQASPILAEAERILRTRCTGHRWELATAEMYSVFAAAMLGRLREAVQRIPALIEEATARGDVFTAVSIEASAGFYPFLSRDAPQGARERVEASMKRWSVSGFHFQHANALSSLCYADLYAGEPEVALRRLDEAWPRLRRSLLLRVEFMRSVMQFLRGRVLTAVAARTGDRKLLARAEAIGVRLAREPALHAVANGVTIRGGVALLRGDVERGMADLGHAEALYQRGGLEVMRFALRHARGRFIGGSEGRAHVDEAEAYLRGEGMAAPARMARTFAPALTREG